MTNTSTFSTLEQRHNELLSAGMLTEAELFAKTIALDKSSKSMILLAKSKQKNNKVSEAIELLNDEIETAVTPYDRACSLIAKAEILAEQDDFNPALNALLLAKKLKSELCNDTKDKYDYMSYSLLVKMGDFAKANTLLKRHFSIEMVDGTKTQSDIFTTPNADSAPKKPSVEVVHNILHNDFSVKTNGYVYLISGGLKQCRLFADKLARQLYNLSGNRVHFHIHGVIAGEDDPDNSLSGWKALQKTIKHKVPKISLSLTLDTYHIEDVTTEETDCLKSCAVYAALPDFVKQYEQTIIIGKPDCLPMYAPSQNISVDADVQLLKNDGSSLEVLAELSPALFHIGTTREAQSFSLKLSNYVQFHFNQRNSLLPGLEIAALTSAYYGDTEAKFKMMPQDIIERDTTNHSPWTFYNSNASYIQKSKEQSAEKFAHFLNKNQADFKLPILTRMMGTHGNEKEAIEILDLHLNNVQKKGGPETFELLQLKALLHAHIGDLKLAQSTLKLAQKQLPSNKHYSDAKNISLYQLGSVSAAIGDIDEAQKIFDKCIAVGCDNGWSTHTGIIDLKHKASDSLDTPNLTIEGDMPSLESLEYVYLVSADVIYCKQFASALIKEIEELSPVGCHLHIHGLGMETEMDSPEAEEWDDIREALSTLKVQSTFSCGKLNTQRMTRRQQKAVYASERFRILPQLLETFQCPVIVADIDQLPLGNPGNVIDPETDVQLLRHKKSVLNFLSVTSATLSVFHPTATGKAFARRLASYLSTAYADINALEWHLDQAALTALAYTAPEDTKISFLDPAIVVSNPHEMSPRDAAESGALFWSVTNSISGNLAALHRLDACADVE